MADTGRCSMCGEYRYWCRNLGCVEGLQPVHEASGNDQAFFFHVETKLERRPREPLPYLGWDEGGPTEG